MRSAELGADALGFNFFRGSKRYISPTDARNIVKNIPPGVCKIGVFVNAELSSLTDIASIAGLDAIQLHGTESSEYVSDVKAATGLQVIKAIRVSGKFDPRDVIGSNAEMILLDAFSTGEFGGTGERFDWDIAARVRDFFPKMFLAGGLSGDNVAEAVAKVRPYGVDACSLLESRPGKKAPAKLKAFIEGAKKTI